MNTVHMLYYLKKKKKLPTECDKITNVHQDCFFECTHNMQVVCLIISLKIHADPLILHYSEVMCM